MIIEVPAGLAERQHGVGLGLGQVAAEVGHDPRRNDVPGVAE